MKTRVKKFVLFHVLNENLGWPRLIATVVVLRGRCDGSWARVVVECLKRAMKAKGDGLPNP
jgi:hypothetical protein